MKNAAGPSANRRAFASAGRDALQLAGMEGQSAAKVKKLSLQVKVSTKDLSVLGSKSVLTDETTSMIMHFFGPQDTVQVMAGMGIYENEVPL